MPCGKSRETVKRSDLAGHAGYEYCASHSRYFWGFRLYLIRTPDGMPIIIWGLANPKIGKREAAETMLRHERHLIRPGQIIIGDKGFAGKDFENFITGKLEAELIRPDPTRPDPTQKTRNHGSGNSAESPNGSSLSFWSSMQIELLNRKKWRTRVDLANAVFEYIKIFYNRLRRHSKLGYVSPIEHELHFNQTSTPARSSHRHG